MIELIFIGLIIALLLYGCITDYRHYHVSNKVTYTIALLALPLVTLSNITIGKVVFAGLLFLMWYLNQFGAADVKVLIPLSFTFTDIHFLLFIGIMCLIGLVVFAILKKNKIPQFIPITGAYIAMTVIAV